VPTGPICTTRYLFVHTGYLFWFPTLIVCVCVFVCVCVCVCVCVQPNIRTCEKKEIWFTGFCRIQNGRFPSAFGCRNYVGVPQCATYNSPCKKEKHENCKIPKPCVNTLRPYNSASLSQAYFVQTNVEKGSEKWICSVDSSHPCFLNSTCDATTMGGKS